MWWSRICVKHQLNPNLYYRWQKEFFERGAVAFVKESSRQVEPMKRSLAAAQEQLTRKNEVLAEVMGEYVQCQKKVGNADRALGRGAIEGYVGGVCELRV
jgi:transposase-like protein